MKTEYENELQEKHGVRLEVLRHIFSNPCSSLDFLLLDYTSIPLCNTYQILAENPTPH